MPQTFVASTQEVIGEEAVHELPACEQAKRIELYLHYAYTMWLSPGAGPFHGADVPEDKRLYLHGRQRSLTALVMSTLCPCFTDLNLFIELIADFDIFVRSNSLHTLMLRVLKTRWLAPRHEELTIYDQPKEAHIYLCSGAC